VTLSNVSRPSKSCNGGPIIESIGTIVPCFAGRNRCGSDVPKTTSWAAILGLNIRLQRKSLGLSQEELAHRVGVDVRYLGGIERTQENPSLEVICAIASALGTSPSALLTENHYSEDTAPAT
jgi:DNA-binding XRE family transcriptional regulator